MAKPNASDDVLTPHDKINFWMLTDVNICQCCFERPEHTKRLYNPLFRAFWGVFPPVAVPYLGADSFLSHRLGFRL